MELVKLAFSVIGITIIFSLIQFRKPFKGFKEWFLYSLAVLLAVVLIKLSV